MKKLYLTILFACLVTLISAQTSIRGVLIDESDQPVMFANVILSDGTTNEVVKIETSDENGQFKYTSLPKGIYNLKVSYVGYEDLIIEKVNTTTEKDVNIGVKQMAPSAVQLDAAVITATRPLVEVKPDRTVFNVEGTINSAGENAIELLRKAPGVLVDNNNNVSVLSRSGVLIYIDGKRLPIAGDDLSNYLQNLPAERIDKIDIISNPGAKYEAEGNAGIIDIRLKKNKNHGFNGNVNLTGSQGLHARGNTGFTGNYRNADLNVFGNVGLNAGRNVNWMRFNNFQNGLNLFETNHMLNDNANANARLGMDFFVSPKSTIGFLVNSNFGVGEMNSSNRSEISSIGSNMIDSILVAKNTNENDNSQNTFNINYAYLDGDKKLNIDADYGRYRNATFFKQPNQYFDADEEQLLTENITEYDTPTDIDIYTFKLDYEQPIFAGQFGTGVKFSSVNTENTFLFRNVINGQAIQNNQRSNDFDYSENVYAAYINYARPINRMINLSAGVRAELTDATGDLRAYDPDLAEPPVELNYINFFPNIGLTYSKNPMHSWSINYGRRINRPDYNVLNPFRIQLSELSYSRGNARLNPEIVNNLELGYTYKYMYNFKLGYSRTTDQITRLIGPDENDPRAGFITWANLATQTIYSANISAPFQVTKWWSMFANLSASYQDNQADYGEGGIVDVQAYSYNIFQQSTFILPWELKGEISGWFSGPGVWGGVFLYDPSYSLNLGIQRKFLDDKLSVKLNASDVTFQSGWSGVSVFNGLEGRGRGNWDSRRVTLSMSYNFGNNNVKSRRRSTGIEDETKRIGSGD